jgi:hypothetical protein
MVLPCGRFFFLTNKTAPALGQNSMPFACQTAGLLHVKQQAFCMSKGIGFAFQKA